jgi:hypothetical protein
MGTEYEIPSAKSERHPTRFFRSLTSLSTMVVRKIFFFCSKGVRVWLGHFFPFPCFPPSFLRLQRHPPSPPLSFLQPSILVSASTHHHVGSRSGLLLGDHHGHHHLSVHFQPKPVRLHRAPTGLSRVHEMAIAWKTPTLYSSWVSYCRALRTWITGFKHKHHPNELISQELTFRPSSSQRLCAHGYKWRFARSTTCLCVLSRAISIVKAQKWTAQCWRILALAPVVVNARTLGVLFHNLALVGTSDEHVLAIAHD